MKRPRLSLATELSSRSGQLARPEREPPPPSGAPPECDWCGSTRLVWRNCKLICENCRQIVLTCGDL